MNNAITITNPLVLYRALVATNRIGPDPSQLRLALHLQKLYDRLKDYEPSIEYRQRLNRVGQVLEEEEEKNIASSKAVPGLGSRGVWTSLLQQKAKRDSLALTKVLSNHEAALQLDSPKGLMLHGEVGTGKSMLIDLFAECLPTVKKKRWHFNTFMLETFSRLEQLRQSRLSPSSHDRILPGDDYSLLWLARDLIKTSPILFLDEFQLPDRTSSKIMANLMTNFFQLGGVLIATSNRMPDELAKAAGMEFVQPSSRLESLSWRLGLRSRRAQSGGGMFAGQGEFSQFLELLKARCEVWQMDGGRDYRRLEADKKELRDVHPEEIVLPGLMSNSEIGAVEIDSDESTAEESTGLPSNYFIQGTASSASLPPEFGEVQLKATDHACELADNIPWSPSTIAVYGRTVFIPRTCNGVASFTFAEICGTHLGPADYISIASTFHSIIVTDVPMLTTLLKNEARRFITLLDALYEARCKLVISAAAGPDDIFFPEMRKNAQNGDASQNASDQDAVYPETFSEVHQDLTAPFRPNTSSYTASEEPDYTHSRLQGVLAEDALEDDPPNRVRRSSSSAAAYDDDDETTKPSPNFGQTTAFTGDDERFAYKRAASRLWEMCGQKWWNRSEEGWWRPLPKEARRWETSSATTSALDNEGASSSRSRKDASVADRGAEGIGHARAISEQDDAVLFKHGASPFRDPSGAPPPKIGWEHVWGTGVEWGKRAGAWGKGVQGLKDRKKVDDDDK